MAAKFKPASKADSEMTEKDNNKVTSQECFLPAMVRPQVPESEVKAMVDQVMTVTHTRLSPDTVLELLHTHGYDVNATVNQIVELKDDAVTDSTWTATGKSRAKREQQPVSRAREDDRRPGSRGRRGRQTGTQRGSAPGHAAPSRPHPHQQAAERSEPVSVKGFTAPTQDEQISQPITERDLTDHPSGGENKDNSGAGDGWQHSGSHGGQARWGASRGRAPPTTGSRRGGRQGGGDAGQQWSPRNGQSKQPALAPTNARVQTGVNSERSWTSRVRCDGSSNNSKPPCEGAGPQHHRHTDSSSSQKQTWAKKLFCNDNVPSQPANGPDKAAPTDTLPEPEARRLPVTDHDAVQEPPALQENVDEGGESAGGWETDSVAEGVNAQSSNTNSDSGWQDPDVTGSTEEAQVEEDIESATQAVEEMSIAAPEQESAFDQVESLPAERMLENCQSDKTTMATVPLEAVVLPQSLQLPSDMTFDVTFGAADTADQTGANLTELDHLDPPNDTELAGEQKDSLAKGQTSPPSLEHLNQSDDTMSQTPPLHPGSISMTADVGTVGSLPTNYRLMARPAEGLTDEAGRTTENNNNYPTSLESQSQLYALHLGKKDDYHVQDEKPTNQAVYGQQANQMAYGQPTNQTAYGQSTNQMVYGQPPLTPPHSSTGMQAATVSGQQPMAVARQTPQGQHMPGPQQSQSSAELPTSPLGSSAYQIAPAAGESYASIGAQHTAPTAGGPLSGQLGQQLANGQSTMTGPVGGAQAMPRPRPQGPYFGPVQGVPAPHALQQGLGPQQYGQAPVSYSMDDAPMPGFYGYPAPVPAPGWAIDFDRNVYYDHPAYSRASGATREPQRIEKQRSSAGQEGTGFPPGAGNPPNQDTPTSSRQQPGYNMPSVYAGQYYHPPGFVPYPQAYMALGSYGSGYTAGDEPAMPYKGYGYSQSPLPQVSPSQGPAYNASTGIGKSSAAMGQPNQDYQQAGLTAKSGTQYDSKPPTYVAAPAGHTSATASSGQSTSVASSSTASHAQYYQYRPIGFQGQSFNRGTMQQQPHQGYQRNHWTSH